MADYWDWNEAVYEEFFTGRWAGKPVYLDIEDDVLGRLAGQVGVQGGTSDARLALCQAVHHTLYLDTDTSIFKWHRQGLALWKRAGRAAVPPFLGLLALLSRAAEEMRQGTEFTAGGYMGSLRALLGLGAVVGISPQKLYRDFREDTHPLWDALNQWLDSAGGTRGIPTARVFDWRVHVGLPISQALVKQVDRERLRQLFADFGLRPRQRMSPEGMERLLADWVPTSNLSAYIRGLWSGGGDGRQRLVEVVCVELEAWDGAAPDLGAAPGDIDARLRLKIRVRRDLGARVDFALVAQVVRGLPSGAYALAPGASEAAIAALGGAGNPLVVNAAPGEAWAPVSVPVGFSPPDLLLARLTVAHPSGARLTRRPRALVVCERDEGQMALLEVDRAQLGHDTVLLAHSSIADRVEAILASCARPGFLRLGKAQGLPEAWCLFDKVQLTAIPEVDDETLGPLVPIAWSQVAFGEGLQLPGPLVFHVEDPPELRVAAADGSKIDVQLTCTQALDREAPASSRQLGTFDGSGTIALGGLTLLEGDYRVEASKHAVSKAATVAGASFRLRSGSWPRLLPELAFPIGFPLDHEGLNPLGAAILQADTGPAVQGARINLPTPVSLPVATLPATLGPVPAPEPEEDTDPTPIAAKSLIGHVACVIGGAHYWLLPTVGPKGAPKWMKGICRVCEVSKWFPRRPASKTPALAPSPPPPPEPAPPAVIPPPPPRPMAIPATLADFDLLLDALTYTGGGSWATFERLTDQMSDLPWFASETARALSALSHIDLTLSDHDLRPHQWAIAPATLVATPDGAVLCGQRSRRLLDSLQRRAGEVGGTLRSQPQPNAPARVAVIGLPPARLAQLAAQVTEDTGIDLQVDEEAALKLAAALPTLRTAASRLTRFHAPGGVTIQQFDYASNRWVEAHEPLRPGAYRFHTRPHTYGMFASGSDTLLRADNRWCKWLAAASAGINLLAYDPASRQLTCRLGAQLPGLYERAAVVASGWGPQPLADATVVYRDTPPQVATAIWARLYDGNSL